MLDGLLGGDPQYDATQLPIDEPLVQPPESAPGILLRIRPFKENQGVVDGAGLLQSVHDVTTNFRGKNTSDHHSFEVWFDEGRSNSSCTPRPRRPPTSSAAASATTTPTAKCSPSTVELPSRYRPRRVRRWCVAGDGEAPVLPDSSPQQRRMGDGPLRRNHERDALTRRQHGRHASRLPARKTVLDGRRPVQAQQRRRPRPRTPARNISWMARSPNAASGPEPEGQAGRQNHRTAAWPASVPTSTSASSQPPRTRTKKPKRVPVGSPGCSESTTTP